MGQTRYKLLFLSSMGLMVFSCQLEMQNQSPREKNAPDTQTSDKDSESQGADNQSNPEDSQDSEGQDKKSSSSDGQAYERSSQSQGGVKSANPQENQASMRQAIENGLSSPQASKLNPEQKKKLGETLNGLCNDAATGKKVDPKGAQTNIKTALNLNLGQTLGGLGQNIPIDLGGLGIPGNLPNNNQNNNNNSQGNGLEKAIQDLVNAAQNANVDGILKAVQDIVGST